MSLFGKVQESNTYLPLNFDESLLSRLINLGLIKLSNDVIEITTLGKFILALIQSEISKYNIS